MGDTRESSNHRYTISLCRKLKLQDLGHGRYLEVFVFQTLLESDLEVVLFFLHSRALLGDHAPEGVGIPVSLEPRMDW